MSSGPSYYYSILFYFIPFIRKILFKKQLLYLLSDLFAGNAITVLKKLSFTCLFLPYVAAIYCAKSRYLLKAEVFPKQLYLCQK